MGEWCDLICFKKITCVVSALRGGGQKALCFWKAWTVSPTEMRAAEAGPAQSHIVVNYHKRQKDSQERSKEECLEGRKKKEGEGKKG